MTEKPKTKLANPSDSTQRKYSGLIPFKPGQSGNPAGRPKGSRNKLGEAFTEALYSDFEKHGAEVIQKVRQQEPAQYLRVIAGLLPKEIMKLDSRPLADLSDEELFQLINQLRAMQPGPKPVGGGEPSPTGNAKSDSIH